MYSLHLEILLCSVTIQKVSKQYYVIKRQQKKKKIEFEKKNFFLMNWIVTWFSIKVQVGNWMERHSYWWSGKLGIFDVFCLCVDHLLLTFICVVMLIFSLFSFPILWPFVLSWIEWLKFFDLTLMGLDNGSLLNFDSYFVSF